LAEAWLSLSREDRAEALKVAAAQTGRAPHLLEKDVWVVWVLSVIDQSPLSNKLTFKGGTSLSKAYKIIDRFSEDIDLTCDIRAIAPDLLRDGNPIPETASQAKKISDHVRARLPQWIEGEVLPILRSALERDGLQSSLSLAGLDREKLLLAYAPIKMGMGYTQSTIQLEFGGRATGEPHQRHAVTCDMAAALPEIAFPSAQPLVMAAERTFWEKATAAHVYCRAIAIHATGTTWLPWPNLATPKQPSQIKRLPAMWLNTSPCSLPRKMPPTNPLTTKRPLGGTFRSFPKGVQWLHWKKTTPPCWKMVCYPSTNPALTPSWRLAPICKT
jgi:hypothetical protein